MAQVIAAYSGRPAFQLRYDVTQTSVSTGTNQSTVSWHVYAICVDASYDSYNLTGGSYAVYMDGVLIASGTKALDFRNSYYGQIISIASGSRVLNHAANGTKTASFSASHTAGSPFGTASTPTGYHNATTINRVPGAPTIGTITDITSSGASVPWSGAVANGGNPITTYNYRVGTTSGGSDVASGQDSASPLPLSGLTRKTTYYVQVQAVSATGVVSAWSAAKSFTTLAEVPVISTTYSAGSITRNSAVISGLSVTDNGGEAPSDARVQYNTSPSASGASVVTRGSWGNVTITGLTALTQYYYRCAAYNSAGWSEYPSTWKTFTTLSDAPDDMAPPTFADVTNTSFTAQWVAPNMNGATFVTYQWALSLSPTFATVVASGTTTATSRAFTGLIPGTRYYFRVRANATPNNGGYGVADQLTSGIAPNSGLRVYGVVGGVVKQGRLYTFVGGVRKQIKPMYAHDGVLETE